MGQSVNQSMANCRHCGLPAPPNSEYCCYGCELAARIAAEAAQKGTPGLLDALKDAGLQVSAKMGYTGR